MGERTTTLSIPGTEAMRAVAEPVRLTTLMALASFGPNQRVSVSDIATQAMELQNTDPVRQFTRGIVSHHCRVSLKGAGLVTVKSLATGKATPPATYVRLTEQGWTHGLAIAGAHLDLQLVAPGSFLEDVLGTKHDPDTPNPRPLLYGALLKGPRSVGELTALTGQTQPTISRYVAALTKSGVLDYVDLLDPANLTYTITGDPADHKTRGALSSSLACLIKDYYDAGRDQITGMDMLRQANTFYPEITPRNLWALLKRLAYQPERARFIRPVNYQPKKRSSVHISEEYHPHIERLFEIWHALSDTSPQAADFREKASQKAWEIIGKPLLLRQTLAAHVGSVVIGKQAAAADSEYVPLFVPPPIPARAAKPTPGSPPKYAQRLKWGVPFTTNEPQPFRPFIDSDKIMWLSPASDQGLKVAYLEACGATLEVSDTNTISDISGKAVACSNKEKFALILLTMGASLNDIDDYCMSVSEFRALLQKLGYDTKITFSAYNRLAYDVCQTFLEPITATLWEEKVPALTGLRDYLAGKLTPRDEHSFRENHVDRSGAYTHEDQNGWQHLNLLMLLAHADERLPVLRPDKKLV
jgi:hypothetical protein